MKRPNPFVPRGRDRFSNEERKSDNPFIPLRYRFQRESEPHNNPFSKFRTMFKDTAEGRKGPTWTFPGARANQ